MNYSIPIIGSLPFYEKVLLGAFGGIVLLLWSSVRDLFLSTTGFCGGIVGSPFDIINVRWASFRVPWLSIRALSIECRMIQNFPWRNSDSEFQYCVEPNSRLCFFCRYRHVFHGFRRVFMEGTLCTFTIMCSTCPLLGGFTIVWLISELCY